MVYIKISEIIGPIFISAEDGDKIYDLLINALNKNENINLDFSNVDIWITSFLNTAIGQLCEKFSKEEIKKRINFINVNEDLKRIIGRIVEESEKYYKIPEKDRKDWLEIFENGDC